MAGQPGVFQNLVDSQGIALIESTPNAARLEAVLGNPAFATRTGDNIVFSEAGTAAYMSQLDSLYVDTFGYGLDYRLGPEIRGFISNPAGFAVQSSAGRAGMFPGTHAEVTAVNAQLNTFSGRLEDTAVSSMWNHGSRLGEPAVTCSSCGGILDKVDVLSNP